MFDTLNSFRLGPHETRESIKNIENFLREFRKYEAFSKLPERAADTLETLDDSSRYSLNSRGEFLTV